MYKQNLALNNLQGLICHQTQPTNKNTIIIIPYLGQNIATELWKPGTVSPAKTSHKAGFECMEEAMNPSSQQGVMPRVVLL